MGSNLQMKCERLHYFNNNLLRVTNGLHSTLDSENKISKRFTRLVGMKDINVLSL